MVRRFLLCALLSCGAGPAVVAADVATPPTDRPSLRGKAVQGLTRILVAERQVALATPAREPFASLPHEATTLLAFSVDRSILGSVRNGVGVDLDMGDRGGFHFNLYARRNPRGPGQRWNLTSSVGAREPRVWSLGGMLDVVRRDDGERRVVYVPQLLMDFGGTAVGPCTCQAALQYAYWRPAAGDVTRDESVPQLTVRLRF